MLNFLCQRPLIIGYFLCLIILAFLFINLGNIQKFLLPIIEKQFPKGLFRINNLEVEKIVVLTIDDGLSAQTQDILNFLDKFEAKATFFIHKNNSITINNYQEIIATILSKGHEIGNHTTEDIASKSLSAEKFQQKFQDADLFLRDFGIEPRFFRAAGGFYDTTKMMPLLTEFNYQPQFVMASFLPWDTHLPFPNLYANQLIDSVFSGAIIVFHDGEQKGNGRLKRTLIALEKFLKAMAEKEYKVVSLAEAIKLNKKFVGDRN